MRALGRSEIDQAKPYSQKKSFFRQVSGVRTDFSQLEQALHHFRVIPEHYASSYYSFQHQGVVGSLLLCFTVLLGGCYALTPVPFYSTFNSLPIDDLSDAFIVYGGGRRPPDSLAIQHMVDHTKKIISNHDITLSRLMELFASNGGSCEDYTSSTIKSCNVVYRWDRYKSKTLFYEKTQLRRCFEYRMTHKDERILDIDIKLTCNEEIVNE